jgi:putative NADH-flavin reductase
MRLVIFGSTGKTGMPLVKQALEAGHEVSAFARTPASIDLEHERLTVMQGDARDSGDVLDAVRDRDAVLSALGSGDGTLTLFGRHVVAAMLEHGVRRIVSLVGAGVAMPEDPRSLGRSIMMGLMKIVARGILQDAERHAEIIQQSDLDWTLVRPPRLADDPRRGDYRHAPTMKLGPGDRIGRADLADFMLGLATSDRYIRQAPMVSY